MKLKEILIDTKAIQDLDMEYPYYDGDIPTEISKDEEIDTEGCSIGIEQLQSILDELKSKGANRIYITSDFDRHGYIFCGVQVK